jgi:hypothetical protein
MGSRISRLLGLSGLVISLLASPAFAQPKNKKAATEAGGDKSIEKQSAWEQKVMGEDSAKKADMKKIAAAQKLAEESRKNPPPEPAVHHKDPNKEGVNAKRESSIGLPIESEEAEKKANARRAPVAKKAEPSNSANDELGALVAASLASDKKDEPPASASADAKARGRKGKSKGKASVAAAKPDPAPSSLDRMFAGGK